MIDYILNSLLSFILIYKYYAIFLITFASALGLLIPSTSVVIAAAAFSSQGYLDFGWVITTAFLGNIIGDNTGYFLTRTLGRRVVNRFAFLKKIVDSTYMNRLENILRKKPRSTIFISRFMSQIGPAVDLLSGLIRFDYWLYVIIALIGELVQVSIFASIGYFLGDQWQSSTGIIGAISLILVVTVTLYVVQKVFFAKVEESNVEIK